MGRLPTIGVSDEVTFALRSDMIAQRIAPDFKPLRRDLRLSRADTERIMRDLVYRILGSAGTRTRRGGPSSRRPR
jgi:hypothetical protein